MRPFFGVVLRNEITGSVMCSCGPLFLFLSHYCTSCVSSSIYLYILIWFLSFCHQCVSYFLFPLIWSYTSVVFNFSFILSSYFRSQQWLWNLDTKTRFWGFASCIASMCLFCSFSSPLPQYDSRWWLSSLLSPMMPQWCHSLLHLCLPPPLIPSHSPLLSLLLPLQSVLISSVWSGVSFALPRY